MKDGQPSLKMYRLELVYVYGDIFIEKLVNHIRNPFWRETIRAVMVINDQYTPQGIICKMLSPLCYSSRMIPEKEEWEQKGVTTLEETMNDTGEVLSIPEKTCS